MTNSSMPASQDIRSGTSQKRCRENERQGNTCYWSHQQQHIFKGRKGTFPLISNNPFLYHLELIFNLFPHLTLPPDRILIPARRSFKSTPRFFLCLHFPSQQPPAPDALSPASTTDAIFCFAFKLWGKTLPCWHFSAASVNRVCYPGCRAIWTSCCKGWTWFQARFLSDLRGWEKSWMHYRLSGWCQIFPPPISCKTKQKKMTTQNQRSSDKDIHLQRELCQRKWSINKK